MHYYLSPVSCPSSDPLTSHWILGIIISSRNQFWIPHIKLCYSLWLSLTAKVISAGVYMFQW